MDISVKLQEDYRLNVRAAAIIIHDNKILVHKDANSNYYALIGGRVELGEDSTQTIKREILEEMGKEIEIIGYAATIENFFEGKDYKTHEIQFVYKAEFTNENDKRLQETIKNVEGNDYLQYEWLDLGNLDKYLIKPQVVKEILKENIYPVHKINMDKKL